MIHPIVTWEDKEEYLDNAKIACLHGRRSKWLLYIFYLESSVDIA